MELTLIPGSVRASGPEELPLAQLSARCQRKRGRRRVRIEVEKAAHPGANVLLFSALGDLRVP